jgi:hypothetical protein
LKNQKICRRFGCIYFLYGSSDAIIIKKIKPESLKERFEDFSDRIAEKFQKNDISEEDVRKAVELSRK